MTGSMGNVGGNPLTQKFLDTSGIDEVRQWHGIYLAKITNTNDPLQQQRATLLVPQVLGNVASNWAVPAFPLSAAPAVGSTVLASFTGGDINRPMYMITPATSPTGVTMLAGDIKLNGSSLNGTLASLQSQISSLLGGNVTIGGNLTVTGNVTVNGTTGIKITNGNLNMNNNNVNNVNNLQGATSGTSPVNINGGLALGGSNINMQGGNINVIGSIGGNAGNIGCFNGFSLAGNNIDMQGGNINDIANLGGNAANIGMFNGLNMGGNNINMANGNLNTVNTISGNGGLAVFFGSGINTQGNNINLANGNVNNSTGFQLASPLHRADLGTVAFTSAGLQSVATRVDFIMDSVLVATGLMS